MNRFCSRQQMIHLFDIIYFINRQPPIPKLFSGRYSSISGVDPLNIIDYFFQFIHYTSSLKPRRSFLQLLWLLCVWLLWGERNNRIFNNVGTPIVQLLDKVKFHFLWWLKAKNTTFVYDTHSWWSDPMRCFGLD